MGNTFPGILAGGVYAVEGVFGDGRASAVRGQAAGRRSDERGCREFGISRKTGYKIFTRYKDHGLEALMRPLAAAGALRQPAAAPDREPDRHAQAGEAALGRPQDPRAPGAAPGRRRPHPRQEHHPRRARPPRPGQARPPAASAGHGTPLSRRLAAQRSVVRRLQGRVQARQRRVLLPADGHRPRLALSCCCAKPLESTREDTAITAFQQLFLERGLPAAIRSDNGVPFASPNALFNLSKLSVWWLRLGIAIERIKPGPPAAERPSRAHAPHLEDRRPPDRPA